MNPLYSVPVSCSTIYNVVCSSNLCTILLYFTFYFLSTFIQLLDNANFLKSKSTYEIKYFLLIFFSVALVTRGYAQDTWTQKADFNGSARFGSVGFTINDKGYLGTGQDSSGLKKDFWQYDPISDTWTQIADLAGPERRFAVAFTVGGYGYVSTGLGVFSVLYDLWQYDPLTNSWTQKAIFSGGARYFAVAFSISDKGYVGTGWNANGNSKKDFWQYNSATDAWTQIADFGPGTRIAAAAFSIGNRGYVAGGITNGVRDDLWQYNPVTNQWIKKANVGNSLANTVGFTIGGKGYVGTGSDGNDSIVNDFWEYDTLTNAWTKRADFAGSARISAVGIAIGNKGYIGTGEGSFNTIPLYKDFWQYSPESNCTAPTILNTTSVSNSKSTLQWSAADGAVRYKVRYKVTGNNPWTTVTTTATTKTISGLSANTSYTWEVKTICSTMPNVSSDWSAKQTFSTLVRLGMARITSPEVYPNPFTTSATILFFLEENAHATIAIWDLTGHRIKTLLDANMDAGDHHLAFNRDGLASGIYLLTLTLNDSPVTMKIIVE